MIEKNKNIIKSCDTNILLYAVIPQFGEHKKALEYLNSVKKDKLFIICELVLVELYNLLRNSKIWGSAMNSKEAVQIVNYFRQNPCWGVVDHEPGVMEAVWSHASKDSFKRTQIFDARLALSLKAHGVHEFATNNGKDFIDFGFEKVMNPVL